MKLGMMLPAQENLQWQLAKQTGIDYAITKAPRELSGLDADPDNFEALKTVRDRFARAGLTLYGLEGDEFPMDRIKLGLPGRDEDIERYCHMLENMGRLGIKLLCYNFMGGVGWFRSHTALPERGGALCSGFDINAVETVPLKVTHEQMWDNYAHFIRGVMPEAEKAGVRMCLHPDDPPIPNLKGYARIMIGAGGYRRAMAVSDSPSHGITFCQSCFRLTGEDVFALLEEFGEKVFFLHFRDVQGNAQCFRETFHDNGPTDMARLMATAARFSPGCLVRPDHTPTMAGEGNENVGYAVQGNVFAAGYIRGIADALGIPFEA